MSMVAPSGAGGAGVADEEEEAGGGAGHADVEERAARGDGRLDLDEGAERARHEGRRHRDEVGERGVHAVEPAGDVVPRLVREQNREERGGELQALDYELPVLERVG